MKEEGQREYFRDPAFPGGPATHLGRYSWSEGRFVEVFDSIIVELITDDGVSGYREVCPLGAFYLPAFGAGAQAQASSFACRASVF
jgi:hypothetical protein